MKRTQKGAKESNQNLLQPKMGPTRSYGPIRSQIFAPPQPRNPSPSAALHQAPKARYALTNGAQQNGSSPSPAHASGTRLSTPQ